MLGPKCVRDLPIYNQAENSSINRINLQDKIRKICEYWHLQKDKKKRNRATSVFLSIKLAKMSCKGKNCSTLRRSHLTALHEIGVLKFKEGTFQLTLSPFKEEILSLKIALQ